MFPVIFTTVYSISVFFVVMLSVQTDNLLIAINMSKRSFSEIIPTPELASKQIYGSSFLVQRFVEQHFNHREHCGYTA